MKDLRLVEIKGGSGLAHEEVGTFTIDVDWPDAFASKPAPTGVVSASGIYG